MEEEFFAQSLIIFISIRPHSERPLAGDISWQGCFVEGGSCGGRGGAADILSGGRKP